MLEDVCKSLRRILFWEKYDYFILRYSLECLSNIDEETRGAHRGVDKREQWGGGGGAVLCYLVVKEDQKTTSLKCASLPP